MLGGVLSSAPAERIRKREQARIPSGQERTTNPSLTSDLGNFPSSPTRNECFRYHRRISVLHKRDMDPCDAVVLHTLGAEA
jgi:hypothetical protein